MKRRKKEKPEKSIKQGVVERRFRKKRKEKKRRQIHFFRDFVKKVVLPERKKVCDGSAW